MVVDNISSSWIDNITSLIGVFAIFVLELTSGFIYKVVYDITLFISLEISNNITFIESSRLSSRWDFDYFRILLFLEVV